MPRTKHKSPAGYVSVSIPLELVKAIDVFIGTEGYRSRPDIVEEAIRDWLKKRGPVEVVSP